MALPRVAVVHAPHGSAHLSDIERSASGLCRPVLLFTEEAAEAHPWVVNAADRRFPVAVAGAGRLVATAAALGLDGVTTFHDAHVDDADTVARALGLPGAPATPSPWDKLRQRATLWKAGLTDVRCRRVDSRQDFDRAVGELPPPCVLKPRRGAGGSGIAFLRDAEDVRHQRTTRTHWTGLTLETVLRRGAHPVRPDWLADFVSVETVSGETDHETVAVFDKLPVEVSPHAGPDGADAVGVTGDVLPSQLPRDGEEQVRSYVRACLEALGVRWRVTHTEVRVTPEGPDLIEINGRVGGHLDRLLRLVGGPDLLRSAFLVALGSCPPHAAPDSPHDCVMGYFPPFPERAGAVRSRVTADDLLSLDGVCAVEEVAAAGEAREATGYRMANLMLRADTPEVLRRRSTEAARAVRHLFAADTGG
ncbi:MULTISPECIES: ATP-grasp domain-containing protein [unclassified Streptomyces]|uniref:ATP-grasp domain-containing protein n=1 Tax=unclassified Streptomyces TaxID=2593676 RepID=UPI0019056C62|nr:ATP-grasp domain-containing protein [Streptomyces sp. HSG2]